jgi:hypothetical protein
MLRSFSVCKGKRVNIFNLESAAISTSGYGSWQHQHVAAQL